MGLQGGIASLKIQGYKQPLGITIGLPEAAALLYASGLESRRPTTLQTWASSLQVPAPSHPSLTALQCPSVGGDSMSQVIHAIIHTHTVTLLKFLTNTGMSSGSYRAQLMRIGKTCRPRSQAAALLHLAEAAAPTLAGRRRAPAWSGWW